jgi:hypothetical protein
MVAETLLIKTDTLDIRQRRLERRTDERQTERAAMRRGEVDGPVDLLTHLGRHTAAG